jgi:hypothetical protein
MLLQKEEVKVVEQLILNRHVCRRVSELMKHETLTSENEKSLAISHPAHSVPVWKVVAANIP